MQVWLKLLIVWFVAIALPVQAMAGVTMAHCGPSHARMGTGVDAAPQLDADHGASAAHHHHDDAADVATSAAPDTAAQGEEESGSLADGAQYKCSSCASCCAGAALPAAMPRLPPSNPARAGFAEELVTVDAFASDGPDRPPRARLV